MCRRYSQPKSADLIGGMEHWNTGAGDGLPVGTHYTRQPSQASNIKRGHSAVDGLPVRKHYTPRPDW